MNKVKFSFIVPTLNEESYIGDCLKSVRVQARKDYEIIVVDGNSTDRTIDIARKYGARVIFCKDKGPGAARNAGVMHAKGSILVFMDADVRAERDFLERVEEKLLDASVGGFICKLHSFDGHRDSYTGVHALLKAFYMFGLVMTAGSCFVYTKDAFKDSGGFDTNLLTNEDHDLARRVSKKYRFKYFDDINIMTSSRRINRKGFFSSLYVYTKSTLVYFLKKSYVKGYWEYDY